MLVVGRQHLDQRVARIVAPECLIGRRNRRVHHRPRMDEIAEVDDARDDVRVAGSDENVCGVDVPVNRRPWNEGKGGLDDRLVEVERVRDERPAIGGDVAELRLQIQELGQVPEQGSVRQWM